MYKIQSQNVCREKSRAGGPHLLDVRTGERGHQLCVERVEGPGLVSRKRKHWARGSDAQRELAGSLFQGHLARKNKWGTEFLLQRKRQHE